MASEPPLLITSPSSLEDVARWVDHIPRTLQGQLICGTTLPLCIFKLPESRISEKPECYIPQYTGLGPIYHFQRNLYEREQLKLITAQEVLKPYNITSEYETIVHDILVPLVTVARSCYDVNFDIGNKTLAWVYAIDALVLIDLIMTVTEGKPSESLEDIMKLENQIPLVVLMELLKALNKNLTGDVESSFLQDLLLKFCEARSPLKFSIPKSQKDLDIGNRFHLLDCMYHLKVFHAKPPPSPLLRTDYSVDMPPEEEESSGILSVLDAFLQPFKDALNLPWDKLNDLIKIMLGGTPIKLEIVIPSVSHMVNLAKIEFSTTPGGIRDIEFDEENLTFSLPVLEMKSDSEVILRNLVVYEEFMFKNGNVNTLDVTEYVDFMCGIVDSEEDVKILREKNIIIGDMDDKEITTILNGITKSSGKVEGMKSKLMMTVDKVNNYYGNVPRVKVHYTLKNVFNASWKIALVVLAIFGLVIMILLGVREIDALKDLFTVSNVPMVFPYAPAINELLDS
ncbi:hypothetical protein L2E82_39124 [Cichorium intybus]|uniref:Uncharacterized protein n=1 Tax=Cichorium intybus TaxID=13427 RepID=A0ACB9AGL7_CICIN|nr:hypothetical protein L2E82_39124 [Cichorium intybus]